MTVEDWADAGTISAANQVAIGEAKLSFILGTNIPEVPYVAKAWRTSTPIRTSDGHVFTQPWPATQAEKDRGRRDQVIHHHKREAIDAHLTIVFAALAVTRFIEDRTDWSIKRFVRTARRYRTG